MNLGRTTDPNPTAIFLPYDAVFDDGTVSFDMFKQTVRLLSRTDALFWCARLNLMLADTNIDEKTRLNNILGTIFTSDQIAKLNEYGRKREEQSSIQPIIRGTLLELIRWVCLLCSDHSDDGVTFNKPEVRDTFARALLMANDLWGRRVYGDNIFGKGNTLEEKRRNSLSITRRVAMETVIRQQPFEALTRGKILFQDFMTRYYNDFESDFQNATGVSIEDYFNCATALLSHYMNSETKSRVGSKSDSGIFTIDACIKAAPHLEKELCAYFAVQSSTADELKDAIWKTDITEPADFIVSYDLKPIRERPVLAANDNRRIIVDPLFYVEQESVGPLFHVTRVKPKQIGRAHV